MRARLAAAKDAPAEQLAIAFDWLRIEAKDDEIVMRETAEYLANRALDMERGRL
jgi:hypothetical protein